MTTSWACFAQKEPPEEDKPHVSVEDSEFCEPWAVEETWEPTVPPESSSAKLTKDKPQKGRGAIASALYRFVTNRKLDD